MPNFIAKYLLAITAVSPAFGAASILAFTNYHSWGWGFGLILAGLSSAFISLAVIWFIKRRVASEPLAINEIELADQKVLEFMLAYLLPIYSSNNLTNPAGSFALVLYSLAVVSVVVVQGNIFQFNPVLSLAGYHFYIATKTDKVKYLVIAKSDFHKGERTLKVKKVSEFIFLEG